MTFQEIFNQDGLYVADGFAEGFAFRINDGFLTSMQYADKDDLLPLCERYPVHKSLFSKEYRQVFTIKQLFK